VTANDAEFTRGTSTLEGIIMTVWIDARVRADAGRGLQLVARAGYAAKSVVYCIVGALSSMVAFGAGGRLTDDRGAVDALGAQPFGKVLLGALSAGLACYAFWNVVRAVLDPEHHPHDRKGIGGRIGYAVSVVPHGTLAFYAASRALGGGRSSSRSAGLLSEAMTMPLGRVAVAIAGVLVIGFGMLEIHRAIRGESEMLLDARRMSPLVQRIARLVGRLGVGARGVVFPIIGLSLIAAARRSSSSELKTSGEALSELAHGPFGHVILVVIAFGLFAYGVHQFLVARYAVLPPRV